MDRGSLNGAFSLADDVVESVDVCSGQLGLVIEVGLSTPIYCFYIPQFLTTSTRYRSQSGIRFVYWRVNGLGQICTS